MKYFGLAALAGALGTAVALALPSGYAVKPGPAVEYTYPAKMPAVKCGHQLLVGCNAQHSVIPCNAHAAAPAPAPHYPAPAPAPAAHYKAASASHPEGSVEPIVAGKHKHKKHKHHKHHKHHHHKHHNKFHHHHHHHHHHHGHRH
ncbi:histidine-rich glycoprotein-like [Aedes aegypti]|uniref:Uncharacterized protein n=1 Tax=Aedes aegypti TaxID=7159 RepID=A0A6I8TSF4_AEDAE|nr:histidine-rich glycoprotein-like [Aedes aegypti]